MNPLKIADVLQYLEDNSNTIHQKRIANLNQFDLKTILPTTNMFLLRAQYLPCVAQIVRGLTDAFISSNEETIFGDWLEGLAIFINSEVYDGRKSGIPGIDLEFDREGIRYIITIKSGPNWGNSSQIAKMKLDFKTAMRTLRTSQSGLQIVAINGCCYGKDNRPDKGDYFKYCGQQFWGFISGDMDLYTKLVEPLGHFAKERNDEFMQSYAQTLNKFTREFAIEFCDAEGAIDWNKLVEFNSGKK